MNLPLAISELLLFHDCVIIPGFGGFVSSYAPATIHPTQHTFTPPSKAILFNRSLVSNDGLLANHLSRRNAIGFSEANSFIEKQVREYESLLANGKKVTIQGVGELNLDVEKNIRFNPDKSSNFLLSSFGLSEFQSSAIRRTEDISKIISIAPERSIHSDESGASKGKLKKFLVAAALIPFTMLLSYLPFHTGMIKKDLSGLNPFTGQEASGKYVQRNHKVKEMSVSTVSFNHARPSVPEVLASAEPLPSADATSSKVTVPAAPAVVENSSDYRYFLVAGCFQSTENAQNYIQQLISKGLKAELIGQTPNGLYRVSCGKFKGRNEAVAAQAELKSQNIPGWILSN